MANEPKTRPTDQDVWQYLAQVTPAKRRDDAQALAAIFADVTGAEPVMWGPSIVGYGNHRDWPCAGFSPRKTQLSLYGLKDLPEGAALLPRLGTYTEGAGCVYVKRLEDVDQEVLRQLIAVAWGRAD